MRLTRRRLFAYAGGGAVAAAVGASSGTAAAVQPSVTGSTPARRRSVRVAHISDIHVQPELRAGEGFAACLRHLHAQTDAPELILNTGDCVMDVMRQDRPRSELQWELWKKILKEECRIPMATVLGNHDIWGWHAKSGTTGNEPGWGKGMALEVLGMEKPYWSKDIGGWHIVGLDSVKKAGPTFIARLEEEQFAWLEADLAAAAGKPTLVMSHMPIMAFVPVFNPTRDPGAGGEPWLLSKQDLHTDFRQIKELFKKHPNVKACLSGHVHLVDRVDYLGVTYMCGGAVSGNWWTGSRFDECDPGYSLIDLYDDGTVGRKYVTYGWKAAMNKSAEDHPDNVAATRASTRTNR